MERTNDSMWIRSMQNPRPESGSLATNLLLVGLLAFGLFALAAPQFAAGILLGAVAVVGFRHVRQGLTAYRLRREARRQRRREAGRYNPTK